MPLSDLPADASPVSRPSTQCWRFAAFALCAIVLLAACGGEELTLTEYVERLQTMVAEASEQAEALYASPQGAVLVAEGDQLTEFTPQDLQTGLQRFGEIDVEVHEAVAAIEPPAAVADLHRLLFDPTYTTALEALAARAGTAATWEELSETPEMAEYRAAVARAKQGYIDIQAQLDATVERAVFADTPWLPAELSEVIEAVLGCSVFPEDPEDLYRPPAADSTP